MHTIVAATSYRPVYRVGEKIAAEVFRGITKFNYVAKRFQGCCRHRLKYSAKHGLRYKVE